MDGVVVGNTTGGQSYQFFVQWVLLVENGPSNGCVCWNKEQMSWLPHPLATNQALKVLTYVVSWNALYNNDRDHDHCQRRVGEKDQRSMDTLEKD